MSAVDDRVERFTGGQAIGVDVTAIERDLANLWRQASGSDKQVTRACSWNFIVHVGDDAYVQSSKDSIDAMVRAVPSHTILVKPRPYQTGQEIEAFVSANCQIAPGGGKLLCTEEITIESRGKGAEHLPGLLRALTVPDVPVALWWAGVPPQDAGAVRILVSGVDRLIVDSSLIPAAVGLSRLAHLGGLLDGLLLVDLAWLRTGPLRTVLASIFDAPTGAEPLYRLKRVRIDVAPGGEASARLLVGWLASRLAFGAPERVTQKDDATRMGWRLPLRGDQSVQVDIDVGGSTERPSRVRGVSLETTDNERFAITDGGDGVLVVQVPGMAQRRVSAPEYAQTELLVASLGTRGRDRLYATALHRAVELER